jgi:hypothetical protein
MTHADTDAEVENFDETEEVPETAATPTEAKPTVATKPKRGTLPDGYVTPVQFAKELTSKGYGNDDNQPAETNVIVPPQVVYSYIKNAPKDHPFPNTENGDLKMILDDNQVERRAFKLDEGLAWWADKVKRAAERKANAAAKKVAKPAVKEASPVEAEGEFTEAES